MFESYFPLAVVWIGVIYFLLRLMKNWGKMSKHETLNAVGVIVLIYVGIAGLFMTFPVSWIVQEHTLVIMFVFSLVLSIIYFVKKNDIALDKQKIVFLIVLAAMIVSAFAGFELAQLFIR